MNIYQALWSADENRFSVSGKNGDNGFTNPAADILLDEQVRASGKRETDLAANPLFAKVNLKKLQTPLNEAFIKLLNNYVVNYRAEEAYTTEETAEIFAYLEAVQETKVWQLAIDYIEGELKEPLRDGFTEKMFDLWFRLYTNWYKGKASPYCSGFEHVFVGEGKYEARSNGDKTLGEVAGYHNWIKFLLDEQTGRVNFLGYNYGLSNNMGFNNLTVVTLQMMWTHTDLNGDLKTFLFKPKGGFFVGSSPECELAMGTVAFFETKKGLFQNDRRKITIDDDTLNLVLFQNVTKEGQRGDQIRSFFPEYVSAATFAASLLEDVTSKPVVVEDLLRLNNALFPDLVYQHSPTATKRSIFSLKESWSFSTKNWKMMEAS
ncbi:poly(U)-specific endoribonuclease [Cnuella takakiae]|uniref:Poly(U)-specific endoribonuclease n=1 Tax=Cnuella takakiae TaxID=1302690 RepID=A0A1M5CHD7_9BACT|nr:hypothetical protein [Cnuella takakiae]OLY91814.1 hypothetical protein BUE76_07810 [Cnuella takakiae]SHF53812.1 poly(U)-specific endoribonuclease [Cnuella takakiae]